jgi:hypothetical protein
MGSAGTGAGIGIGTGAIATGAGSTTCLATYGAVVERSFFFELEGVFPMVNGVPAFAADGHFSVLGSPDSSRRLAQNRVEFPG